MPSYGNQWFGSSAAGGFYSHQIEQSCRFDEDAGDKLTRTPSSGGSRTTFTVSFWLKRTVLSHSGNHMVVFGADPDGGSNYFHLRFDNDDRFRIDSSGSFTRYTTATFKDVASWGHFFVGINTAASPEVLIYHNGIQITAFDTSNGPSGSFATQVNHTVEHQIGVLNYGGASTDFAGYLAEFHLVDGEQKAHTDFGQFKNDVWIPKKYTGSHGTNGFHLKFEDASDLGNDSSGNNNDYSATNLGTDHKVLDSPTFGD